MNVIRRRGWEMPESRATPEHLFFNRRAFLGAAGAARPPTGLAPRPRASPSASPTSPIPTHRSLSGQAQREIHARPPDHRREDQRQLQQFLRVQLVQEHRQGGAGAEDPAVDDQDRRHGGEAVRDRHRRSGAQVRRRGAALPPPLRRGLEHGDAVVGLPDGEAGRAGEAAVVGDVRADGDLPRQGDRAGTAADLVSRGPMSRASPWRRRPTSSTFLATGAYGKPIAKQHGAPIRLAVPWKYGFKTIKSIVRFIVHRQAAEELLGGRCRRPNTASGPTSIRRCRIRAGARRARS